MTFITLYIVHVELEGANVQHPPPSSAPEEAVEPPPYSVTSEPPANVEENADEQEAAVPEKIADDDAPKEPLYRRVFFTVFPQLRRGGARN